MHPSYCTTANWTLMRFSWGGGSVELRKQSGIELAALVAVYNRKELGGLIVL